METRVRTSSKKPSAGRIVAIDETGTGSVVEFACDGGATRRVHIRATADPAGAASVLRCARQAHWVLFHLDGRQRATVGMSGHRLPAKLRVSVATALGLARDGIPAYVSGGAA